MRSRHAHADQRIDQPLRTRFAVRYRDREDRTGRGLSDHDAGAAERTGHRRRGEHRKRQARVAAAQRRHRELSGADADHRAEEQPHRVEPALPQCRVEADEGGDRREDG